jgi:choline kinase
MKAIILAAGVGKRLAAVTRDRPKCLVELGGRPLLIRYLDALLEAGVKRAAVVVGHKREMIERTVGESYRGLAVQYVVNDQYQRGSLYSLWLARVAFDDDVLIMDADVLCPSSFVARLVHSPHPNALLIDETVRQQVEERMAIIHGSRVVALTKKIPQKPPDLMGEGVGFLKVTRADTRFMLAAMEPYVTSGELDMEYEDAWESFFRTVSVGYETIGGQPWIEIDFPEDLERAEREIVPRLT